MLTCSAKRKNLNNKSVRASGLTPAAVPRVTPCSFSHLRLVSLSPDSKQDDTTLPASYSSGLLFCICSVRSGFSSAQQMQRTGIMEARKNMLQLGVAKLPRYSFG